MFLNYEDKSKFGQKMLEKMGWSEGKGLGANEDGTSSHINVAFKCNSAGLGFKGNPDTVEPLSEEYDKLLNQLSAKATKVANVEAQAPPGQTKVRHRYSKIFKAKNASQYSEKDLAAIFGTTVVPSNEGKQSILEQGEVSQVEKISNCEIEASPAPLHKKKKNKKQKLSQGDGEMQLSIDTQPRETAEITSNDNNSPPPLRKSKHRIETVIEESASNVERLGQNGVNECASDDTLDRNSSKRKSKKRKLKAQNIAGGYVKNEKVSYILANSDEIVRNVAGHEQLSTSSLLKNKGYGSELNA